MSKIIKLSEDLDISRSNSQANDCAINFFRYTNARLQFIIRKSDLDEIEMPVNGLITKVGFWLGFTAVQDHMDLKQLRIQIGHTSESSVAEYRTFGLDAEYLIANKTIEDAHTSFSLGIGEEDGKYFYWDTDNDFKWNGESNLLIEISRTTEDYSYSYEPAFPEPETEGMGIFFPGPAQQMATAHAHSSVAYPDWFTDDGPNTDFLNNYYVDFIVDMYFEIDGGFPPEVQNALPMLLGYHF